MSPHDLATFLSPVFREALVLLAAVDHGDVKTVDLSSWSRLRAACDVATQATGIPRAQVLLWAREAEGEVAPGVLPDSGERFTDEQLVAAVFIWERSCKEGQLEGQLAREEAIIDRVREVAGREEAERP